MESPLKRNHLDSDNIYKIQDTRLRGSSHTAIKRWTRYSCPVSESKTYILHNNISSCTYNGMRTGELWLLAIFVSQYITSVLPSQLLYIKWTEQNIPDIVQQLHIALLGVYTESLDKRITHRARRFTRFVCISTRLWIFASTPHNLRKRSSPTTSLTPEEGRNLRHLQG